MALNGKAVTEANDITAEVAKSQIGEELTLTLQRAQQNQKVVVRVGANPGASNLQQNNN
ncbi:hypothetical protein CAL7716_003820 [Calothrix sp. PCC 7716]|nr:hypothetical protein CAL7716_003820 [Calothrix sp. PCC 7716]